jgi:hypothetical protein
MKLSRNNVFVRSFIETGLLIEVDQNGRSLDENYDPKDLDDNVVNEIVKSIQTFYGLVAEEAPELLDNGDLERKLGQHLWCTRNADGVLFWQEERWNRHKNILYKKAKEYTPCELYAEDGRVYFWEA